MLDEIDWYRLIVILLVWTGAWLGVRLLLRTVRDLWVKRIDDTESLKRLDTVMRAFRYVMNVLVVIVVAVLLLAELGVSIAPILGAAGIAGVAIGFAAQSLVKDVFRGVVLLVENQIRVGDVVEVAGKGGLVEEVTLRYVRLRDYEGNVHFVSNGEIQTVTNRSVGFAFALLDIGVGYGADCDRAMQVIREVVDRMREEPDWAAKIVDAAEIAGVERWADSSIMIKARVKVVPLQQWAVRRELLRRLKHRYDEEGIEIPFPHLKLYIAERERQQPKEAVADHAPGI
jgi:moderate conductance mechanosensitive channel